MKPVKYIKESVKACEEPLQNFFVRGYLISLLITLFSIAIFAFTFKWYMAVFVFLVGIIVFGVMTFYLEMVNRGNYIGIEGVCVEIQDSKVRRDYIQIVNDNDILITIYVTNRIKAQVGNTLKFYINKDVIREQSEDSFVAENALYGYIVKANAEQKKNRFMTKGVNDGV